MTLPRALTLIAGVAAAFVAYALFPWLNGRWWRT